MTDPEKNTPDSTEGSGNTQPEYGSASDYDATASASLSDSPVAPEPGAVFGAPGTGPGWSSQPTYPPPSAHTSENDPAYGQQAFAQPFGQSSAGGAYTYPGHPDPTAPYGRHPASGEPLSDKSKIAAGLLQILLGFVSICGVGRLYIGSTGIGLTQMLLVFLGYILMIVLVGFIIVPVVWLWAFVDGVLMLTGNVRDSRGRPLRD